MFRIGTAGGLTSEAAAHVHSSISVAGVLRLRATAHDISVGDARVLEKKAATHSPVLFLEICLFCVATLPAAFPVCNEELERSRINVHAGFETDAEIAIVHFVLIGMSGK